MDEKCCYHEPDEACECECHKPFRCPDDFTRADADSLVRDVSSHNIYWPSDPVYGGTVYIDGRDISTMSDAEVDEVNRKIRLKLGYGDFF